MKNPFEKALNAKKAAENQRGSAKWGAKLRRLDLVREREEQVKNRKVLSSTRADKK